MLSVHQIILVLDLVCDDAHVRHQRDGHGPRHGHAC